MKGKGRRLPRISERDLSAQVRTEVDAEIEYHLARLTEEFMAQGMAERGARAAAQQRFGDLRTARAALEHEAERNQRSTRRARLLAELQQDGKYGFRMLLRNPLFAVAAVLTLALGIGANTGMFAVAYGIMFRPLPYTDPDRLVLMWEDNTVEKDPRYPFSPANYRDLMERNRTLERIGGFSRIAGEPTTMIDGQPQRIRRVAVYGDFFRIVGVQAQLGRTILPEDEVPGSPSVVLLSDGFWRRSFAADPKVLGSTIEMWGAKSTIVGVLPPGFDVPTHENIDVVGVTTFSPEHWQVRSGHSLHLIARLRNGATIESARADVNRVAIELEEQYPDANRGMRITMLGVREALVGRVRTALIFLLGAVALVLLLACANIANLLLARAAQREREMGVRVSLGATRMRLARQLLTESGVLALLGAVCGIGVAVGVVSAVRKFGSATLPLLGSVELSRPVLAFALGAATITALAIGTLPALRAAQRHFSALRESSRGTSAGRARHRTRRTLAIVQVSVSLVLLTSAALLLRSYKSVLEIDPGFETDRVLTFSTMKMCRDADCVQFYKQLEDGLRRLPGVESVGSIMMLPLTSAGPRAQAQIEGVDWGERKPPELRWRMVTQNFFSTMRMPVVRGRLFEPADEASTALPLVLNRAAATRLFGERDPVGHRLRLGPDPDDPWRVVIGVVENARNVSLTEEVQGEVFALHAHVPSGAMTIVLRTSVPPRTVLPAARAQVAALDRTIFLGDVRTTAELVANTVAQPRFVLLLLIAFATLGVTLTVVGTYGVLANLVAQRRREIGIRVALGAQRADVLRIVLSEGAIVGAAGIAIGLAASLGFTRALGGMLHGINPTDPLTLGGTALLMAGVTLLACWLPARAATRVEVNQALLTE